MDFDVYGKSEEKILLCFQQAIIVYLNLRTKQFTVVENPGIPDG